LARAGGRNGVRYRGAKRLDSVYDGSLP
jgi:hypothetical protein